MAEPSSDKGPAFYFALPRLINKLLGRSSDVSENNWLEAYLGSFMVFAISYAFGAQLFVREYRGWSALIACVLLVFAVCVFWLLALYVNSLVIKAVRACGFFRETPDRYMQDVLVWIVVTIFAARLAVFDSWVHWIGIVWLALLPLNVAAALCLVLSKQHGGTAG